MSAAQQQVALITGAAKRLGAVTVRALHQQGYKVIIHYHTSADEALALAHELNDMRADSAAALRQDLADAHAGPATITRAVGVWQRLDLLVNNASVFDRTPIDAVDVASWDRIHAINVRAPYFLSISAAPFLRSTSGSIVNIADIHAERPRSQYSTYCVSKAGLVAITRALALDFAPAIRVNCVAPGAILWAASEDAGIQARTVQATPLQRQGEPADIAEAVCYLARARFVTGQVINVDGGRGLGL